MQRRTVQREAIQEVFRNAGRPLRLEDILELGRLLVPSLNQATVYRNLKLLVEAGWLEQVQHPTLGTIYERSGRGHHHHFHCNSCDRIYELPGCALNPAATPEGFVVEAHEIFLSGTCPACVR
ncbi:MAG: transcriptional repressor [Desulfobulbaceae bacterium]|nr:transcriptional repressor [Desulfobulbaceae bacterium]